MATPLLKTKLYIPPVREELVPRVRLIRQLDQGVSRKLTLVSAPAGFGKTTLLTHWAHERLSSAGSDGGARPVAWLSLDEGDNDPVRFFHYLVSALQQVDVGLDIDLSGAFQAPQPPQPEILLTTLINGVAALSHKVILVLDDYHVIQAQSVCDALGFLLDHLPQQMHLVISTRSDPPLQLPRLRGRGEINELRASDLRFTLEEGAVFLNQVMGLGLSTEDVAALATRTEGWIAGLQMAAVSMLRQDPQHVASFVQAFKGSHRYVLDYLMEEVLQRQPEHIQSFLLQTSVLDRLSGPLCDAVTGQRDSQAILMGLDQSNLFIVPLDQERCWYRYHRLFADLLQQRLHQLQPDIVSALHRRASDWFQRGGFTDEAIEHALSAQDFEHAVQLVEQAAETIWARSEVITLLGWLQALPDDVVSSQPRLGALYALALLMSTHPLESVQARLQEAERADETGAVAGEIALVRALIAAYQGDTKGSALLAHRALEQLPAESLYLRSLGAGIRSLAYLYQEDIPTATQALQEAVSISRQAGNVMNTVLALCHLAELSYLQGRLHAASDYYDQALEAATDAQGRHRPIACVPLVGLGELQREWNDLEAASRHLTESIELSRGCGEIWVLSGHIVLAYVRQAQGDARAARAALQTAQQIAVRFDAMQADDLKVAMNEARLSIVQGRLGAAEQWVRERGVAGRTNDQREKEGAPGIFSAAIPLFEAMILARLRLAQGQPQEALKALEPMVDRTESAGWMRYLVEAFLLQALAYYAQGDLRQALAVLERALVLAEPAGYVRLIVEEGEPMATLLRHAATHGIATEYVARLLTAFEPSARCQDAPDVTALPTQPLIEPLTERELDVLRLLKTHLSSTQIADELYIAPSTVRSHTKSIYGKLNVHSRSDAVQRAEELGLL
jgi:LuxR family maltose regulon positive regulatory protein